jgi:hypothetical protein
VCKACPYCGRNHVHDGDPHELLSDRVPHCYPPERRPEFYVLEDADPAATERRIAMRRKYR